MDCIYHLDKQRRNATDKRIHRYMRARDMHRHTWRDGEPDTHTHMFVTEVKWRNTGMKGTDVKQGGRGADTQTYRELTNRSSL